MRRNNNRNNVASSPTKCEIIKNKWFTWKGCTSPNVGRPCIDVIRLGSGTSDFERVCVLLVVRLKKR